MRLFQELKVLANVSSNNQKCHSINIFETIRQLSLERQKHKLISLFFQFLFMATKPTARSLYTQQYNSRKFGIQKVIHKYMNSDSLWIIVTYRKIKPWTSARPWRMTYKNWSYRQIVFDNHSFERIYPFSSFIHSMMWPINVTFHTWK